MTPLTVLHLGALDSVHLRRWVEMTRELGHEAVVAGHLRPGLGPEALAAPHRAPQLRWASTRHARASGRRIDRALAGLPNGVVEVPLWARWLRRLTRRIRPDVVHAHYLPQWGAAAGMAGASPLVASALGSDVYLAGGVDRRLADAALARADAVVAPSPHAAAALSPRTRRPERLVHLETGVDLHAFHPPSAADRLAARRSLGLAAGPVVLSFRGASPVYDLPLAVEAFRRLRRRRPDAQLVVAHGALPLDRLTAAAIRALGGAARVLGAVPPEAMPQCFHAADVGVSVASSDGSPNSIWECLACAVPVVASALPQLAGRVGGGDGVLLVERRPEAVASALESTLADGARARALGQAGRSWCEANVDRGISLARLDGLYSELAALAQRQSVR